MDSWTGEAYAAYNLDEEIRRSSSSGAVFYELAKSVIKKKGIVFGAKFDETWKVVHSHAETLDGILAFLGSKYVQSNILKEYQIAKQCLDKGKLILFSGTPCQIAGLKTFLKQEYENLLTVDFICHGVPSSMVWNQYLAELSTNRKIRNINFRDKTESWLDSSLKIDYEDGSFYKENKNKDFYMKGFIQDIYLRPSCYECRFKGLNRCSDITLADFWGIQNLLPDMFDDKGASFVLVHSQLGRNVWKSIQKQLKICEIDVDLGIKNNLNAIYSVKKTYRRKLFFRGEINIKKIEKLTKVPLLFRLFEPIFRMKKCHIFDIVRKMKIKQTVRKLLMTNCLRGLKEGKLAKTVPILYERKELCCGCTACYAICPKQAISMVEDEEGFYYPKIDKEKCIQCYYCVGVCPIKQRNKKNSYST